MTTVDVLLGTAGVIKERGQVSGGHEGCRGTRAPEGDAVCLVCAMSVAVNGQPGVINEPVKDAMYAFSEYLGLPVPGDVWDWDVSTRRAGWLVRDMLRSCASGLGFNPDDGWQGSRQ